MRRTLLVMASAALGVILIAVLIKVGRIDLRVTFLQLWSVSRLAFVKLALLTGLHVYLSNLKWRSIDAAVRHPSDSDLSRATSFALTSIGVALGQILPIQLSMTAVRTMGTHFYGRAVKRGTAGTLFEQSFDVLIAGFLAVASGVTWFYKGGAIMWTSLAIAMTILALLVVGPTILLIRWLAAYTSRATVSHNRVLRSIVDLPHSGFLNDALSRRLMMLSAARFVIQVLMAVQTADAVGAHIPFWQLAASLPFAAIACVIALTPGGIGLNELSVATALSFFGTPLAVGAQWALANRFLVAGSSFFVAGSGVAMLGLETFKHRKGPDFTQEARGEMLTTAGSNGRVRPE